MNLAAAIRDPRFLLLRRMTLLLRGLFFAGFRVQCPCCNWRFRSYVRKQTFFVPSRDSSCPRCNAKARHRRIWLYLQAKTAVFSEQLTLMDVGTWWSFGRRFSRMENVSFVGLSVDLRAPFTSVVGDLGQCPLQTGSVDVALCIHVLEHIQCDGEAMRELYRVVKDDGWALVSVPLLLSESTREDPNITNPEDRQRIFGERGHVRYYGMDIRRRLEDAGFTVEFEPAAEIAEEVRTRYGLRGDENLFVCRKTRIHDA